MLSPIHMEIYNAGALLMDIIMQRQINVLLVYLEMLAFSSNLLH